MQEHVPELTMDAVRARMKVVHIEIAEARLEMVRGLLNMALAPIRAASSRAIKAWEPAVTFKASSKAGHSNA